MHDQSQTGRHAIRDARDSYVTCILRLTTNSIVRLVSKPLTAYWVSKMWTSHEGWQTRSLRQEVCFANWEGIHVFRVLTHWTPRWVSSLFSLSLFSLSLSLFSLSSHLISSHLISSHLIASRLVSSRLVSSRLVSCHRSRLVSSHFSSSQGTCSSSKDVSRNVSWAGSKLPALGELSDWCSSGNQTLNQKERYQQLQSQSPNVCDVEMVRHLYYPTSGRGTGARGNEATALGRHGWYLLPTSLSVHDPVVAERLGSAGRQKEEHVAWKRKAYDVASVDIKTAVDAGPRYIANILGDQNVHGWIVAAFLREMAVLERKATFEHLERLFSVHKVHPTKACGGSSTFKMAMQIIWNVEESWKEQEMELHSETTEGGSHHVCSFTWADDCWNLSQSRGNLQQMMKECLEEVKRWDMQPEPRCLLWTSTSADEKSEDMIIRTAARENRLPFRNPTGQWSEARGCGMSSPRRADGRRAPGE